MKESWFKINSSLVVENPANWSRSRLGVLSELSHEALLVFLFLKVAGNFQTTFRVSRDVLARVADVTGNGRDLDDLLHELETCNLIQVDGEDFTLTDSSAVRKAEADEEPSPAPTPHTPKPRPTKEELRAKAFAGQFTLDELFNLQWDSVITVKEYDQLEEEHKYIGEDPLGPGTETKK
jgi:hypothetical protein